MMGIFTKSVMMTVNFNIEAAYFLKIMLLYCKQNLILDYGKKEEIEKKVNELLIQRKEKQPLEYPSAGSTFKRGENYITAKLIDECGLKGYQIGGAQVSEKHAGFIVNKNNATSTDILKLIEYVQNVVKEKTSRNNLNKMH